MTNPFDPDYEPRIKPGKRRGRPNRGERNGFDQIRLGPLSGPKKPRKAERRKGR